MPYFSPSVWDQPFWARPRSPVEVRDVAVNLRAGGTCSVPEVYNAVLETLENLDWAVPNRLLRCHGPRS